MRRVTFLWSHEERDAADQFHHRPPRGGLEARGEERLLRQVAFWYVEGLGRLFLRNVMRIPPQPMKT